LNQQWCVVMVGWIDHDPLVIWGVIVNFFMILCQWKTMWPKRVVIELEHRKIGHHLAYLHTHCISRKFITCARNFNSWTCWNDRLRTKWQQQRAISHAPTNRDTYAAFIFNVECST
jgi:hypothetical protein